MSERRSQPVEEDRNSLRVTFCTKQAPDRIVLGKVRELVPYRDHTRFDLDWST